MRNIFLAPRSNETAYANYISSMQGKPLDELKPFLTHEDLQQLGQDDRYFVWGCQPSMESRWQKMQKGDYVLFYARGKFISYGQLKFKKKSEALALSLWPESKDSGKPWSCVFFVENIHEINLPLKAFTDITGYEMKLVQGFMRVTTGLKNIEAKYGSTENFMESLSSMLSNEEIEDLISIAAQPSSKLSAEDKGRIDELTRTRTDEEIDAALARHAAFAYHKAPEEIEKLVRMIKRNRRLVADIKAKYRNKCQICGFTFKTSRGDYYSEAAHIIPISSRQEGMDSPDNIWVLCANHHRMLDMGALKAISNRQYSEDNVVRDLLVS